MKKITLPLLFAAFAVLPSTLFGQDNEKLIKDYISQNKIREYKKSDLTNFIIDNVDNSKSLNGNVVKFQQTYNGFPVYSSVGTVLIKDNKVVYYTDNFVKNYFVSTPNTAVISETTALQKIAEDLQNQEINNLTILNHSEKSTNKAALAIQRLVYANDGNENLRLAYEYSFTEPKSVNYWNILVDANNGKIIEKNNLTLSCNFTHDPYSSDFTHDHFADNTHQLIGAENKVQQNFPFFLPDNASYNVFPLPIESASFGSRSVISNPWILNASPEGWHSNGTTHYTVTRGNNVFAYEDVAGTALTIPPDYLPGTPADGGATRNFNFPFNIDGLPAPNRNAAITNLFYLNNRIHDVFYQFGFTESARNFQDNNFGKGGVDDDYVYAEAQDGSGLNNANFGTPQDGFNPRMQMYLWLGSNRKLFYNAPSDAVARVVNAGVAQFGPALSAAGITGDVKLASNIDGCTALPAGEMTGKIGLIERGGGTNCGFAVKVKNAQNAGAIGTIIYNNTANGSTIGNMGGTDATITIPSILITNIEGEFIKTKLSANNVVNVDLRVDAKYDGSFDNGIVTHEYGHGISNRLTGDGYSCLNALPNQTNTTYSKEQMGEGWSDFFALMLTNKAGDNASVPRGMGTYVIGQGNTGDGIRPAKYSPNFTINGFTYGDTNGMEYNNGSAIVPDVHSIGFVWATMLWDLHWKYVEKYGYSSDVTANTTNGSSKVLQLITDALKLQACDPSFIEGRNAILAAELATTAGVDKCMIWNVFAKRGLGVNASAGAKMDINDQVEDFTVPAECNVLATNEVKAVKNTISIYPNPAKNEFFINFPSNTLGKVSVEIYDMSGKLVSSEDKISPDAKKAISTDKLVNGTYMVKIKGLGFDASSKVIVKK
ncbi:T9SS-dependent M36 family metallopeptidase [Chryseobacterium sp. G0201]|uniref:T9SS-dependent M36 family metallopeptidase n=1 Tax=Chryseobacterium sp. G0201 TaxID=2487065 RepID=UPI000F4D5248|nr:T9SS-dependent M36 family metallopeptidase [Chryseobacterium sp. G0201]AZA54195.1 T9SS C-terminal target domain-containing protein [Chryseobacterium sp. G0201]